MTANLQMFRFATYRNPGSGQGARHPGGFVSYRLVLIRTSAVLPFTLFPEMGTSVSAAWAFLTTITHINKSTIKSCFSLSTLFHNDHLQLLMVASLHTTYTGPACSQPAAQREHLPTSGCCARYKFSLVNLERERERKSWERWDKGALQLSLFERQHPETSPGMGRHTLSWGNIPTLSFHRSHAYLEVRSK